MRNRLLAGSGLALCFQLVGNKGEVGIAFLGNGNLLVSVRGLFWYRRSGRHIVPRLPVCIRDRKRGMGLGRSPLRYNNRCLVVRMCCLYTRVVEWRSAAVAEDRLFK